MPLNTLTVALSTTPTILSTLFTYPLARHRGECADYGLSYAEGIALIRRFLVHASHHTVEELQAFTAMYVPSPAWVRTENVSIGPEHLERAAGYVEAQLGEEGLARVGGRKWWRWREGELRGEWVWVSQKWWSSSEEEVADEKTEQGERKTMLYVHGGAYYFGSVDEHRYQLQRHARKLGARVFAPRYRLAPQFPFPCAIYDVLAWYFHLLEHQPASSIIFAGDSAGGGLILSLLCLLRDQGLPLPAGAVLISPWVDLCHSFPSVISDNSKDYIPPHGFLHRPSAAWPPPSLKKREGSAYSPRDEARVLKVPIDGETVEITEQIQLYTTNDLLTHPLVSPVNQPTLAGLCPLLVLVGGGEVLRDEQVFVAHKAAFPSIFNKAPPAAAAAAAPTAEPPLEITSPTTTAVADYPPTPVHLQVFPDACHVLPTLAWTRPAKRMCASIAAFGQKVFAATTPGEISGFTYELMAVGDATPIAQQPLSPKDFPDPELIGVITTEPVKRWLVARKKWDEKYPLSPARDIGIAALCGCAGARQKGKQQQAHEEEGEEMEELLCEWDGEFPPPSAAVLRRGVMKEKEGEKPSEGDMKKEKGWGMSIWAGWGAKSDGRRVRGEETPEGDRSRSRSGSRSRARSVTVRESSPPPTLPPIEV